MPKIDDAAYEQGRAFYASGISLKEMVKPILEAAEDASEDVVMSRLIGFADGLLDALRRVGK